MRLFKWNSMRLPLLIWGLVCFIFWGCENNPPTAPDLPPTPNPTSTPQPGPTATPDPTGTPNPEARLDLYCHPNSGFPYDWDGNYYYYSVELHLAELNGVGVTLHTISVTYTSGEPEGVYGCDAISGWFSLPGCYLSGYGSAMAPLSVYGPYSGYDTFFTITGIDDSGHSVSASAMYTAMAEGGSSQHAQDPMTVVRSGKHAGIGKCPKSFWW